MPVTYPRFCLLISCPDYLTHITDKQEDRFFVAALFLFSYFLFFPHFVCVCVCALARARVQGCLCGHVSETWWLPPPWLCLLHSCAKRYPHCCPSSESAFKHRLSENETLTWGTSLFCSLSTEHIRDGVTEPCGRSVAKEEYSSQGVLYYTISNVHTTLIWFII